jgi:hypothetical protein
MRLAAGPQPEQRVNFGLLGVPVQSVKHLEPVPPGQRRTGSAHSELPNQRSSRIQHRSLLHRRPREASFDFGHVLAELTKTMPNRRSMGGDEAGRDLARFPELFSECSQRPAELFRRSQRTLAPGRRVDGWAGA